MINLRSQRIVHGTVTGNFYDSCKGNFLRENFLLGKLLIVNFMLGAILFALFITYIW